MKPPESNLSGQPLMSGDGTCEILVHIAQCPLTFVCMKFTNGFCMRRICAGKSREGATNKDGERS